MSGYNGRLFEYVTPVSGYNGRLFEHITPVSGYNWRLFEYVTPVSGYNGRLFEHITPVSGYNWRLFEYVTPVSGYNGRPFEHVTPASWPWIWLPWRSYAYLKCEIPKRLQFKLHSANIVHDNTNPYRSTAKTIGNLTTQKPLSLQREANNDTKTYQTIEILLEPLFKSIFDTLLVDILVFKFCNLDTLMTLRVVLWLFFLIGIQIQSHDINLYTLREHLTFLIKHPEGTSNISDQTPWGNI